MAFIPSKEDWDDNSRASNKFVPSKEDWDSSYNASSSPVKSTSILERIGQIPKNLLISGLQEASNVGESLADIPHYLSLGAIPAAPSGEIPGYEKIKNTPEAWGAYLASFAPAGIGAAKIAARAPGEISNILSKIGFGSKNTSKELLNSLLGKVNLSEAHRPILNEIRQNYNSLKDIASNNYDEIRNLSKERGYTGNGNSLSKALGVKSDIKSIDAHDALNKISELPNKNSALTSIIDKFKESPSFDNAHNLQARLFKEGDSLRTSADGEKRLASKDFFDARDELLKGIESSFKSNGDIDLYNKFKKASDFYKKEIVPYHLDKSIRDVVTKRGIQEVNPLTIAATLNKESAPIKKVVSDLSPESKGLIFSKSLNDINSPSSLSSQLSKLKTKPVSKFLTRDQLDLIDKLQKQTEFERKYGPSIRKGTGIGVAAMLSGLGINELRKYL